MIDSSVRGSGRRMPGGPEDAAPAEGTTRSSTCRLRRLATTASGGPGNAGELPGEGDARTRIVGAREPLLVGGEAAHVVHLEEELAGAEGVTRVLPGQLEQTKALRRALIMGNKIAMQVRADVGIVQIGPHLHRYFVAHDEGAPER